MFDFLKVVLLIVVLFFAYWWLQNNFGGDDTLMNFTNTDGTLQVTDEELWSTPSPYRGLVTIEQTSTPTALNTDDEYIYIKALSSNSEALNMTGWSLQSLVSNTRVYIPPAVLTLKMTESNNTQPVYLAPDEYAIVHTGRSPIANIATSFHTNMCIGYVSAFYDFKPQLRSSCNKPSEVLPPTAQNIKTYGAECVEFLSKADSCKSYTTEMPAQLLPACRDLIARKFTYHTCLSEGIEKMGYDVFNGGGWYLYLNLNAELWRYNYEAIQLLDQDGLTVDVLRY